MTGYPAHDDGMDTSSPTTAQHRTDARVLLDRAIATTGATVTGVRADQLTAPTPCTEMDVRTMLGHLVGVADRITALGRGEDPLAVVETPAPGDDWETAWSAAGARAASVWSDADVLARPMALPWIQGSGAEVLASYLSELTVHTWDLATATGQRPDWDDDVVEAALGTRDMLPAENRRAIFEEISTAMGLDEVAVPFAEAVAVADDAPAIDRLVAWNGRDPRT